MKANGFSIQTTIASITVSAIMIAASGCTSTSPKWIDQPWTPIESTGLTSKSNRGSEPNVATYETVAERKTSLRKPYSSARNGRGLLVSNHEFPGNELSGSEIALTSHQEVVRGQDPGYTPGGYSPPPSTQQYGGQFANGNAPQNSPSPYGTTQAYSPQQIAPNPNGPVQPPGYFETVAPNNQGYVPNDYANIDVLVREAQTGKMTFGAAYNSNSGLVGQIIIDERNFDILGFPKSLQEIVDGTAWRGRGQGFRMELVPGSEVQRYLVSFTEPYLFNSQVSFSASGYFFDRRYFDWDEQRLGGRVSLGYRLTPDLSLSVGVRMENVNLHDPRVATSPSLNAALGDSNLYLGQFTLINDTRDHPFMATEGSYLELSYQQGFGDFDYPRGDLDYRRYWLVRQRPDGSGRHTLSYGTKVGVSGSSTPVYENYFAGGFSTLRGFDFRGASPLEGGAIVGGRFQWLNTLEYTFPITADDMFKGVLFCDFGTVEQDIEINSDNFRVAPGFGFRVHMPVGGAGGAPLAFDFAFPVEEAATDDKQVFSFYMSAIR